MFYSQYYIALNLAFNRFGEDSVFKTWGRDVSGICFLIAVNCIFLRTQGVFRKECAHQHLPG